MRLAFALLLLVVDLSTLLLGLWLAWAGLKNPGDGNIAVVIDGIGKITGANGPLVVGLSGVVLVGLALSYAYKAAKDAASSPAGAAVQPGPRPAAPGPSRGSKLSNAIEGFAP